MLFKQYIEITKHEKVISTEICTPIFYAMYLKKKTKVLEESRGEIVFDRLDDRLRENEMAYDTKWINNSYKIYRKKSS